MNNLVKYQMEIFTKLGIEKEQTSYFEAVAEELEAIDSAIQRAATFASFGLCYLYGKEIEPTLDVIKISETKLGILLTNENNPVSCIIKLYGTVEDDIPLSLHYGIKSGGRFKEIKRYNYNKDTPNFFIYTDLGRIYFLVKTDEGEKKVLAKDITTEPITGIIERPSPLGVEEEISFEVLENDT